MPKFVCAPADEDNDIRFFYHLGRIADFEKTRFYPSRLSWGERERGFLSPERKPLSHN